MGFFKNAMQSWNEANSPEAAEDAVREHGGSEEEVDAAVSKVKRHRRMKWMTLMNNNNNLNS